MSDYNRGAYTPPSNDAPLAFDARRPVRGGSPAPVTLIISAVVLLVLIVGAWFIYKDGFRTDGEAPKTVGAVVTTPKTAPEEDDQPKNETGGLVIYNQEDGLPPADPKYAPPPETPLPRPAPPKVDSKPVPPPPAETTLRPTQTPAAPPPAKAEPKPTSAPPAAATPNAKGNFLVQVGAFSSPALADKGWSDAAAIAPGAAAGKGKKVESVESGGKTLYRTSVTGFPDRASAQDFCDRLKAAGKACFVR